MFIYVQSFLFDPLVYTQADSGIHYLEQDECDCGAEDYGEDSGNHLHEKLVPVPVQCSLDSAAAGYRLCGKHARKDGADDAAYSVDSDFFISCTVWIVEW